MKRLRRSITTCMAPARTLLLSSASIPTSAGQRPPSTVPWPRNPKWRYRVGTDLRNENWTVQTSFTGPSTFLGATNLRRKRAAEITRFVGARWSWTTGLELSHRDFRNVVPGVALTPELLAKGYQIKQKAQFTYELWRSPEKRMVISSSGNFPGGTAMVATGAVF